MEIRAAGVHVTLEPGTLTVVTGEDATTLLDLATGLAPTDGVVKFNGTDVRLLTGDEVPSSVAVVTSNPFLIAGSVRDNICLGAAPTEEEVRRALWLAAIDGPAPDRRQIGLARALLRLPALLILDRATDDLAPDVEARILRRLAGTALTVLATAHRESALARADQVITLGTRPAYATA
ncbi:ABC transporter ATP-binding protein/permease [Paractinoplanes brasiliensis]|uniref:ABC transporter ATP-binding protein/permease n=1 Tax=Paractinoplanes brasiliensis TaxID=52695 RepID=UPI0010604D45|nr:ABC transporter ATP-binding protein/permease [Actinoplanes brasiliensis]